MKNVVVIALAFAIGQASAAPTTGPVVQYMFEFSNLKKLLHSAAERQTANEPELRGFALSLVDLIDIKFLVNQESALINRMLPVQEAQVCLSFVEKPLADKVATIVRRHNSPHDAVSELEKLPPSEWQLTEEFLSSNCFKKALAIIQSAEFLAAVRKHGEALACAEISSNMPENLPVLHESGRCLGAEE